MKQTNASRLLARTIDLLESSKVRYLFGRNYEGYPETLTGDVDICLEPGAFHRIKAAFESTCRELGWRVFRQLFRPHVSVYQLFQETNDPGERRFLVMEFFHGFTWLGADFLSYNEVWDHRLRYRNFWAADRMDGVLTTLLHYYFWSGFIPEKYVSLVRDCVQAGECDALRQRLGSFYPGHLADHLGTTILNLLDLPDTAWKTRQGYFERRYFVPRNMRKKCQHSVMWRFLRTHPGGFLNNAIQLMTGGIADLFSLPGTILCLWGNNAEHLAMEVLREAKAFHLYKNSVSRAVKAPVDLRTSWRVVVRGGLLVVWSRELRALPGGAPRSRSHAVISNALDRYAPGAPHMLNSGQPMNAPEAILAELVRNDLRSK